ncbi:MAG TPA: acyl-CoA dehydrogenase family protein [Micromonosporaceae bacterium]
MDFALDEACVAAVQTASAVLDAEAMLDASGTDAADRTWKALGGSGLLCLSVPRRLGGEGLGVLASMVVLTEIGRRAVALPALPSLALGVLPLVRWATPDQQDALLPGTPVLTAGLREAADPEPTVPATRCTPDLAITGTKVGVAYADRARAILVPVRQATGQAAVAIVDPSAAGVTLTRTPSSGDTPEWTVVFDGAVASGLLGGGAAAVEDLYRLALAGACALGDGAVAGALALTSAHVRSRQQFGRRLAEFQAVAQQIADVWIASRTLHLATLSACWRLDRASDPRTDLDVAGYWLAREAPLAVRTCHHLHGGLGLDVTYPLHRYTSLVKDLVRAVGGARFRLDALGRRDDLH